jgi:hypothetical protein
MAIRGLLKILDFVSGSFKGVSVGGGHYETMKATQSQTRGGIYGD